jgi:hypothetical protein
VATGLTLSSPTNTALQTALSLGVPPALSLATNAPHAIVAYTGSNGTAPTVLSYAELTPTGDIAVGGLVTLTFGFPPGTLNPSVTYLYALWFGQLSSAIWLDGNATNTVDFTTQTITITATPNFTFRGGFIYGFAIYHN